ncbi:MAG: sulfatase [Bacteroidota bacterium]
MRNFLLLLSICLLFACQPDPVEEQASRPNILFAIADDASFPHMGAYGCSWVKTPAFDRVAREGILFTRAYTPNAKCSPSRACILTGRNSWQLERAMNHVPFFPPKFKTYPEALTGHDYYVGYTAKGWAPGVANDESGNPRQLTGIPFNRQKLTPPANFISSSDYAANFGEFLDSVPDGQAFCYWYGSTEPHRAYEYGAGINKGGKKLTDIDKVFDFWPDNDTVRTDMLDYAYEIEYFDLHLQKMLAELEARGLLENTLVVVTADNGMPFPRIKGQKYELSNHLPLAMMWPKGIKNPGRTVDEFVNFIDFAPTFLELAGLGQTESGMQPITGSSLTDILYAAQGETPAPIRDHVLIGKERHDIGRPNDWGYPVRGIVTDEYLYLKNFEPNRWPVGNPETGYLNTDGSPTKTQALLARHTPETRKYWEWNMGKRPAEELYHIASDPECMNNLAGSKEHQTIKTQLADRMRQGLTAEKDPRMLGNGHIFDEYPYAHEETKGFYERFMSGEKMKTGWVNPSDFEKEKLD